MCDFLDGLIILGLALINFLVRGVWRAEVVDYALLGTAALGAASGHQLGGELLDYAGATAGWWRAGNSWAAVDSR